MDKAPAYGAGDSGFESQYGLTFFFFFPFFFCSLAVLRLPAGPTHVPSTRKASRRRTAATPLDHKKHTWARRPTKKEEGVMRESNSRPPAPEAGIIPLDQSPSCAQYAGKNKQKRDTLELNQRPIGLQPIALPLS